jgi:hypothetical protein
MVLAALEALRKLRKSTDGLRGHPQRSLPCCETLKSFSDLVNLPDVPKGENADKSAFVRNDTDEPLMIQSPQGLTHGSPAYLKALC